MAVVRADRWKAQHGEHRVEHLRAALQAIADADPETQSVAALREHAAEALRADDREEWSSTASGRGSSARSAP
jgi:hypothetical protein